MNDLPLPDATPNENVEARGAHHLTALPDVLRYGDHLPAPRVNPPAPVALAPMPAEIAAAIIAVCRGVKSIGYDGKNSDQKYSFASIDAFLAEVGKLCADAGLAVIPEEVRAERISLGEAANRYGEVKKDEWLDATYRFWLMHETGAIWQHPMERRIQVRWSGPQGYGSAESYVLKRFLRALFKVPTGDAMDPASDVLDPDAGRGAPANRASPADPLFGKPADPPPGFTSATEKPRRGAAPATDAPPPEPTALPPVNGEAPYCIHNALGERVSEFQDLKSWGLAMKKHLGKFPASADHNRGEVARLRQFFLADPDMDAKARTTLELAFDSLSALLDPPPPPPPPSAEPPHDPQTGELHPEPAAAGDAEPNPYTNA